MNSISPNLNIMIKACERASKSLIRDFGEIEKLQVSKKGPKDFVTNSDLRVEKIIIDELEKARPNYCLISEELGIKKNRDSKNTWIIDPIDGTVNFLHGVPHFAISIALKNNNEIISGLVYDPIKDEMFFAEKNNGAFLNNQKIRVSGKNDIENCLFTTGGTLEKEPDFLYRKSGCAALDLAYVAAGRYDGYWQREINYWDIAAGVILVKESGGFVGTIKGDDFGVEKIDIIATNSKIHKELKNLL